MLLRKIHVKNFRNFDEASYKFNPALTIIFGNNARGKTNLIEAIYFLINGEGFRQSREEEFLQLNSKDTCMVEGVFASNDQELRCMITLGFLESGLLKKTLFLNKAKKRRQEYRAQQISAVLFAPHQIEVITGTAQLRREYFNKLISLYDLEYQNKLRNYETALRKRNKLLESFSSIQSLEEQLVFWDNYLEEQAAYLVQKREEYLMYLNSHSQIDGKQFTIVYLKSKLTAMGLKEKRGLELKVRRTMVGPQKDDFQIFLEGKKNVHIYGSRSQQRFAILWLKLNEITYCKQILKKIPLLLLDDIFSEFDKTHRQLILKLIASYQTILSTTEPEILELTQLPNTVIQL